MKQVLMIAYYFPPIAATEAMRPLNSCRHLPTYGWMLRVLATDHPSALPQQAEAQMLLNRVPSGTEVVRVSHGNPLGQLSAYPDRLKRIVGNNAGAASRPSLSGAATDPTQNTRKLIDALLNLPDPHCRWYQSAVRAVSSANTGQRPDVIWATGGPWTSLLVRQR